MGRLPVLFALLSFAACARGPGTANPVIHARFDPSAKVLPMPTDILRDAQAGHLALPDDDPDLTASEAELYTFLNTLDGWSTVSTPTVSFTDVIAGESVTEESVQVWQWDGADRQRLMVDVVLDADGRGLTIHPPDEGWRRGVEIVVVVTTDVRGARAQRVECDAAFYFLRLTQDLTDPSHNRAFPGATSEERAENAAALEEIRVQLSVFFDDMETRGIARSDVAALWTFTTTQRTEVAMDKTTHRVPLPVNLLIDPVTGLVDLPVLDTDSELEADAKVRLNRYDGFGTTMAALFEFAAPVDPATVTTETVEVYQRGVQLDITVEVAPDLQRVRVTPDLPLRSEDLYTVVLRRGILDAAGDEVIPMVLGKLINLENVIEMDSLPAADAARIEVVRAEAAPLLDALARDNVIAAWPFTTMTINDPLVTAQQSPAKASVSPDPTDIESMTPTQAVFDFPLSALTLFRVDTVYRGNIETVDYLDPITREVRSDGTYEVRSIPFTLTMPEGLTDGEAVPVVIFGHGLMAERRFVLGVGDALAARGFAAISIDFPYHGDRSVCKWDGPICFPDPIAADGSLICPDPCRQGSTCADDGKCYDGDGLETELSRWPVIPMYQSTGAAFVDVENIAGTRDHFFQSIIDLAALSRSLQLGDWESATGQPFDATRIHYVGQSLGGIMGGTYTPLDANIARSVLNVPGGNLVDMFVESTLFGGHIDAFRKRHDFEEGSAEDWRFLSIAHWFVDSVDPINVAPYLINEPMPGVGLPPDREVFVQMALIDIIIPNSSTTRYAEVGGLPRVDYLASHTFLTVPIEPEFIRGTIDAGNFIEGTFTP